MKVMPLPLPLPASLPVSGQLKELTSPPTIKATMIIEAAKIPAVVSLQKPVPVVMKVTDDATKTQTQEINTQKVDEVINDTSSNFSCDENLVNFLMANNLPMFLPVLEYFNAQVTDLPKNALSPQSYRITTVKDMASLTP